MWQRKVRLIAGLLLSPYWGDINNLPVMVLLFESHISVKNNIISFYLRIV